MRRFWRRLVCIPGTPELAEVATNAIALGWAWALLRPATFGPPGTTVHHVVGTFGSEPAAAWALATAILPIASIAIGSHSLRMVSTIICGSMWSLLILTSARGGVWLSPSIATGVACLIALFVSQCRIAAGWRREWLA